MELQELGSGSVSLLQCTVQRSQNHVPHRPVDAVHIRPVVQQHFAHVRVVVGSRRVQEGPTVIAGRVHLFRTLLQQPLDEFSASRGGGLVDWKVSSGVP